MEALKWPIIDFFQALSAGLLVGGTYGLMCVGLGIIFGVMRVVNFAQGDFMMLGMYVTYYLVSGFGILAFLGPYAGPVVGAALAGPIVFVVGWLLHRFLISRVTGDRVISAEAEGHYTQIIMTLGVALVLSNGGLILFGSQPVSVQTPLSRESWEIGPIFLNQARAVAFVLAVAFAVGLYLFLTRSDLGKTMRAAADNPIAAAYMGINVDRSHRFAFGLGVGITAIAGGLIASSQSFQPYIGLDFVIVMYAGVVLGGMGSILGAFWGGLTIGLVQQMSTLILPYQLQNTAIFVGVPADHLLEASGDVRPRLGARLMRRSELGRQYLAIFAFAAVYLLIGWYVQNSYYQLIMTLVLIWATAGVSWNMLSGYSGMISFGHAAFFGVGGYTMTIAFVKFGITPWIGIPLGVLVGVLSGIVIGLPTFRLRGHYFALSMLAYPLAMLYVFEWMGFQEVSLPMKREAPALYAQFSDPRAYIALALVLLVICMIVSLHVERSRFGMALTAIKQNEPAASAAGINTLRWKMLALMVSAGMGAAAGGLYAIVLLVVTPQTMFGALVSAQALTMAMFGGIGVFWGPVIGAAVLVPLAETLECPAGEYPSGYPGRCLRLRHHSHHVASP